MDKKQENKMLCENCRFYLAHYIKKNAYFRRIADGHCINEILNKKYTRNKYSLHENCKYWESNVGEREESKYEIEKVIRDMHKQLKEIEQILKDEN